VGEILKPLIGTGGLVPDELVTTVLATELKKAIALEKGVLFDGFPRNLSQIHILEKIAIDAGCKIDSAIYLSLNEAKAVERIQRRALKENREDDQNLLVITKRMNEFREKTVPVIRRYEELGILLKFDGSGTPEEVYTMVSEKLLELSKND
jgi:adenylate kinase